ncbi:threonine/serine ThrE exporter family protein [Stackebrandtia nassauensis]|uniref:threonine/serine ThrE exporter family protein n=1 Tax=Stackebrandtia nassauensis TaxID=283811 RepID=UPI00145CBD23|nr:threonine/serine exporter family protein [Stackebrandtia nassauensis]
MTREAGTSREAVAQPEDDGRPEVDSNAGRADSEHGSARDGEPDGGRDGEPRRGWRLPGGNADGSRASNPAYGQRGSDRADGRRRVSPGARPRPGDGFGAGWRRFGSRLLAKVFGTSPRPASDIVTPPPPEAFDPDLLNFLRQLGVALSQSGETTNRVKARLAEVAAAYDVDNARFLVLPTGVFVRLADGNHAEVDFAPADNRVLDLEQIDKLYGLVAEVVKDQIPPAEGIRRLHALLTAPPRFGPVIAVAGNTVLAIGFGMLTQPTAPALIGYAVLGVFVGVLYLVAERFSALSLALPVVAAMSVTVVAFEFGAQLTGVSSAKLIIPPLIILLPGAALTIGTIDLATGSIVAGSARLIYGLNVLFLLALGVYTGVQLVSPVHETAQTATPFGWWGPVVGVILVGLGHFLRFSAPTASLPWLILVLLVVWGAQVLGTFIAGPVFGAFLGGLVITPAAYTAQARKRGPAAQVTYLPSFWLLVPGALGLTGLSRIVVSGASITGLVTALMTVAAIALGVLVGSSLTQSTTRQLAELGDIPAKLRRARRPREDLGRGSAILTVSLTRRAIVDIVDN